MDLVIALDNSNNVEESTLDKLEKFLVNMMESYEISKEKVRVSIMTFGGRPRTLIDLKNGITKERVRIALRRIQPAGNSLNLHINVYLHHVPVFKVN